MSMRDCVIRPSFGKASRVVTAVSTLSPQLRPANVLSALEVLPDLPQFSALESAAGIITSVAEISVAANDVDGNGDVSIPILRVALQSIPPTPVDVPKVGAPAEALLAQARVPVQRLPPQPIATPLKKEMWFSTVLCTAAATDRQDAAGVPRSLGTPW
ncbi:hypothetical protein HGRIS_006565 [Hohenbuehelia grisea]|uniref:Uncharacterized protein n=1 Tax=Hohenbuehelia grisea TaxID=104357 RepID=A0ABR3J9V9_9AGAR